MGSDGAVVPGEGAKISIQLSDFNHITSGAKKIIPTNIPTELRGLCQWGRVKFAKLPLIACCQMCA